MKWDMVLETLEKLASAWLSGILTAEEVSKLEVSAGQGAGELLSRVEELGTADKVPTMLDELDELDDDDDDDDFFQGN